MPVQASNRPSVDQVCLDTAKIWSGRSTCLRRAVGCVLADDKGRVLSTGYNGVARGQAHCNQAEQQVRLLFQQTGGYAHRIDYPNACPGARAPSGTDLDGCHALHAEQNALLQCRDPDAIEVCYCTTAPCMTCTKLLLNTGCRRIVFLESYPQAAASRALWVSSGRLWEQYVGRNS